MDNYGKVAEALMVWVKPRILTLIKQQPVTNTVNEYLRNSGQLKHFINFFGIDLMKYQVVDELGFIIDPLLKNIGGSYVTAGLKKIPGVTDENITQTIRDIVQAALKESETKQSKKVNIFGVLLNSKDLAELQVALEEIGA
jgi:hypothetical protein